MYKCQKCNKISKPGESINKFVVSTREKKYINKTTDKKGNEYYKTTYGNEIVKEIIVCQECYDELVRNQPKKQVNNVENTYKQYDRSSNDSKQNNYNKQYNKSYNNQYPKKEYNKEYNKGYSKDYNSNSNNNNNKGANYYG